MDIFARLIVGLVAGLLASHAIGGVAGVIFVAFVGAVALSLVLRAVRPRRA